MYNVFIGMKFIKKYWLVGSLTGIFLFLSVSGFVFAITPPGGSGGTGSGSIATDASGNIGIRKNPDVGTTYELDVAGDIRGTSLTGTFLGDVPATRVSGGGTFGSLVSGGNYTFPASLGVGGVTSFGAKFDVDGGSGVAGRFKSSADGDTFIIYNSKIGVDRVVTRFANNSGWNVTGAGGIQRGYAVRNSDDTIELAAMRGDGSGYFSGKMGIGVSSPTEKLEVAGAVKIGTAAGTAAGTIRWTGTDFEGRIGTSWVSMTGGASGWADDGTVVRLATAGDNVGIGTSVASSKLTVSGNVLVRSAGAMGATDNLFDLGNLNSGELGTILKITNANPNNANAAVMIGKVGISTSTTFTLASNATNTLEVKGTIYADRVLNAVYAP